MNKYLKLAYEKWMEDNDLEYGDEINILHFFYNPHKLERDGVYDINGEPLIIEDIVTLIEGRSFEKASEEKILSELKHQDVYRVYCDGGVTQTQYDRDMSYDNNILKYNSIRLTKQKAKELKLFNKYLSKLYMACQEDRKYNEPYSEIEYFQIYYNDGKVEISMPCEVTTLPKDYCFITYEKAEEFIEENKELIKKVLGD